jgi:hypothetical protein
MQSNRNDSMKQRMVMLGLAVFLIWWGGGSASAQNDKKEPMAKLAQSLVHLHEQYTTYLAQRSAVPFSSSDPLVRLVDQHVVVDAVASGDVNALKADLESLGMQHAVAFGRVVSGQLPMSALAAVASMASLQFAQPATAILNAGTVTSQGDQAMRSNVARANIGVDGTGITVGVLSDSFDCLGGASTDMTTGDLSLITVMQEKAICSNGTDEGRAGDAAADSAPRLEDVGVDGRSEHHRKIVGATGPSPLHLPRLAACGASRTQAARRVNKTTDR